MAEPGRPRRVRVVHHRPFETLIVDGILERDDRALAAPDVLAVRKVERLRQIQIHLVEVRHVRPDGVERHVGEEQIVPRFEQLHRQAHRFLGLLQERLLLGNVIRVVFVGDFFPKPGSLRAQLFQHLRIASEPRRSFGRIVDEFAGSLVVGDVERYAFDENFGDQLRPENRLSRGIDRLDGERANRTGGGAGDDFHHFDAPLREAGRQLHIGDDADQFGQVRRRFFGPSGRATPKPAEANLRRERQQKTSHLFSPRKRGSHTPIKLDRRGCERGRQETPEASRRLLRRAAELDPHNVADGDP